MHKIKKDFLDEVFFYTQESIKFLIEFLVDIQILFYKIQKTNAIKRKMLKKYLLMFE